MPPALYMLDTNTFSYIVRGRSEQARRTMQARFENSVLCISVLTEAEILYGLAKVPGATRTRRLSEEVFTLLTIFSWDASASRAYAALKVDLLQGGKALDIFDMLIAAHALATGAVLVTHDRAFLNAGTQLQVEDWATDLQP